MGGFLGVQSLDLISRQRNQGKGDQAYEQNKSN